jgi:ketosteroid isomerase-like protein
MPGYAPDVLTFDVVNPLQYIGRDAATKRTEGWFSSGPINCEIRDLNIATDEDVASSPNLSRFSGAKKGGGWSRISICRCHSIRRAARRRLICSRSAPSDLSASCRVEPREVPQGGSIYESKPPAVVIIRKKL